MSDEDLKKFLDGLQRWREEHPVTPESARALLTEEGILDADGELTEHYR